MDKQSSFVHGNSTWKRLLSICMALVLVLALIPASVFTANAATIDSGKVLYLKPNSNWLVDGARFAAYFFGNGEAWASMTDSDGDGYYEVTVPGSGYTNVIFCRMNGSNTTNNWNNKWNQTSDLTVEGNNNCYTITDGSWDSGSWSNYAPVVETEPKPAVTEYYLIGYINGADYGDSGDHANFGDYKFVNGSVTVTFTETSYVCVKNTDMVWYMTDGWQGNATSATLYNTAVLDDTADKLQVPAGTATFTLVENADGTLTLSYTTSGSGTTDPTDPTVPTDPTDPTVPGNPATGDWYLVGYINGKDYTGTDYKFSNGQLKVKFDTVSNVCVKNGDGVWYMTDGWLGDVKSATLYDSSITGTNSNKMKVPGTVELILTLTENEDGTLTLSYKTSGVRTFYMFGYINGEVYGEGNDYATLGIYKIENGTLTTTFPSDSYIGLKTADCAEWYMTNGWYGAKTTATLYESNAYKLGSNADKLLVPGGVELTFTIVENDDFTVTISYTRNEQKGIDGDNPIQQGLTLHCWNWSYENIEKNMATIADMGYTAIQTSPAQVMKEATVGQPASSHWWVFYQPVDFKMNTSSDNALGTKEQFKKMCETADKYGIKVIVDVVANHLGNQTGNDLSNQIPSYIRNNAAFWHDYKTNTTDYTNRYDITQHCMAGLPDLNTGNKELQGYVLDYLKECIDAGADGFRFDATKHIETPEDDATYASDFWPTVVGGAEKYAKDTYGIDLYCYGELLDNPGGDKLPILAYTKHLAVTDNSWSNCLRQDLAAGKNDYNVKGYNKAALPGQMVLWAESHDTYSTSESGLNSAATSTAVLHKSWALVAARKDAMSLYFVRPANFSTSGTKLGEASLNTGWANAEVKAINKFHNAFVGQSEVVSNEGKISYVERGTSGVVLVNAGGTTASVNVTAKAMANGTYTDQITGNTFTVANGKISGNIGSTGIAVVYNPGQTGHEHSYSSVVTAPTCTEDGYTTYSCSCGHSYKSNYVTATGHSYENGTCGVCGAADPDYVEPVNGTITLKGTTLSLEEEILYNLYFTTSDMDVAPENMGMLVFNTQPANVSVNNANQKVEGALVSGSMYMVSTLGISGKNLGDTVYLVAYAKLDNGSYVYSSVLPYSAKSYCFDRLEKSSNANLKALCVAILNYGAAAQEYFAATSDYTYTTLMNADLTAAQKALVKAYSADMMDARGTVTAAKAGTFGTTSTATGFSGLGATMSADGIFSINYYFTTSTAASNVTMYYWTAADFAKVSTLTKSNATGSKAMTATGKTNQFWGSIDGIAAKDLDKTIYVCGVYTVNGTTYSTGVFAYSLGYYCVTMAASGSAVMKPMAAATAVYGYYAKTYFGA